MYETDILIVGGGPAGLLAADNLSKKHRVVLIERGVLGHTTKCWVTTQRRLLKHGLQECVLATPTTMTAGTFLGGHVSVEGDFAVVDDQRVLQLLVERCKSQGARLIENCSLLNLSWTSDRVLAQTTFETFRASLVIDATGGLSPVANTFRLHRIDGFYSIYGALLQHIKLHSPEIVLGYVSQLGDPPPILEIFPTGSDSAYVVVFVYSKALAAPRSLAAVFEDHCRHNPFFTMTAETVRAGERAGAIPIGRRAHKRLRGVVPFGEAGLIQPPLMGTAFNETLEHSEALCRQLSDTLIKGRNPVFLRLKYPLLKRSQDFIQRQLIRMILSGNVERFDKMLRAMSRFPEEVLFNFFSNELSWGQASSIALRLPWYLMREPTENRVSLG